MITYTEKGHGLHEAIRAAGHYIKQENGVWLSSNDTVVQAIIDGYTIADVADSISNQIDAAAKSLRERFLKGIAPGEMAAWATKYAEVKALQAGGPASAAVALQAEADFRGVTLTNLAAKVLTNFNTASNREAKIAGIAGKHKDAVKALGTIAAMLAYDWQTPMNAA